jgi:glycosyltransferase involved in cell wall biosynthesis
MIDHTPRVSIGLPVYNGEKLLRASVESLLQQSFKDFELVITDNASTDNTEAIGRDFMRRDRRVRYFRNPRNIGAAHNFNRALELARGEYFKWAAHDDRLAPDYLEKCVHVLDNDPSIVCVQARTMYVDLKGNQQPSQEKDRRLDSSSPAERFWDVVIETHAIDEFYGVMRRDTLLKTSGHGPFFGADKVLLAELAMLGRIHAIPERLFLRGAHPGQSYLAATTRDLRKKWMDTKAKLSMSEARVFAGYVRAAWSVPLPLRDRAKCQLALMYYTFGWNPWKRRLRRMFKMDPPAFGSA